MGIYISNFKWAWQALMFSHVHIIWQKCISFIDLQMMLQGLFAISIGFEFRKITQSIPFQVSSVLCLDLPYTIVYGIKRNMFLFLRKNIYPCFCLMYEKTKEVCGKSIFILMDFPSLGHLP